MANSYTRSDVIAAWQFESGALATAAKGGVDLTLVGTPTEDATNFMEGACGIALAAATPQYAKITDANLPTGFPLKTGDTTKMITVSCWCYPTTVDGTKRRIWSKSNAAGNKRGIILSHNTTAVYLDYSVNGTAWATAISLFGTMTANQKYFYRVTVDGAVGYYYATRFDSTAGTWSCKCGTLTAGLFVSDAEWRIGADVDLAANTCFNGTIDEVIVSNARLHHSEAVAIKGGNFPVTGLNIYDYLHDFVSGNDTNDGFSATNKAFKSLVKALYPGDIINDIKAIETVQGGGSTATATNGSRLVTGISGWTPSAGNIIRFDSESTIYSVASYASGTITLFRTYEGVTGGGKIIKTAAPVSMGSNPGNFNANPAVGNQAYPIVYNGGINFTNMTQDGFSLYTGSLGLWYTPSASPTWWVINNLGIVTYNVGFGASFGSCVINNFYGAGPGSFTTYSSWTTTFNNPVFENSFNAIGGLYNCILNNPKIFGCSGSNGFGLGGIDTLINNLRISSLGPNFPQLSLAGYCYGLRFVNPLFDEFNITYNEPNIYINNNNNTVCCEDVVFENPKSGNAMGWLGYFSSNYQCRGQIHFNHIQGDPTDNRTYILINYSGAPYILEQSDNSVFHAAAPSNKITLPAGNLYYQRHYIPCDAGVPKTVSAWMRKNSSFGNNPLPYMRIRWTTGSAPNLVTNIADYPMPDVNDTWEQVVAAAVTPSVNGVILVEFYFTSPNAGAIAWYDDIGVA